MQAARWLLLELRRKSPRRTRHTPDVSYKVCLQSLAKSCTSLRAAKTVRDLSKHLARSRDPSLTLGMATFSWFVPLRRHPHFGFLNVMAQSRSTAHANTI